MVWKGLSTNGAQETGHPQKSEVKITSGHKQNKQTNKQKRWVKNLNVKSRTSVFSADNIREYLYDLGGE